MTPGAAPIPIKLPLLRAEKLAAKILAELAPFCDRIEIAGSIRRRRPEVGDIDIVCLPKNEAQLDCLRARARKTNPWTIQDGRQQLLLILDTPAGPIQLDLWFAQHEERDMFGRTPGNWGSLLLCRTGSARHNVWLIEQAKRLSHRWNPYSGIYDQFGKCLASQEEAEIFTALQLDCIPPEDRER